MASGSEVSLALQAREALKQNGVQARVVSMPSWELFAAQSSEYQEATLPASVPVRLAIEAGAGLGWHRWVGRSGAVISLERFGASAPQQVLYEQLGFSVKAIVDRAMALLAQTRSE
jgi:transketolase